ncbi:MAG: ATP-binding protein, partial [Candidatus Methanomethylophilaceae archaeon]|nr:ATP-binding protein [Candidatus Methanomethylophilaceae archaeon]
MAEFIGREKELRTLQEIYELRKFMCCAVIGRRRIGKSSLIEKFVEDKRSLYFEFVEGTPETNLRIMEIVIGDYLGEKTAFESFVDAF